MSWRLLAAGTFGALAAGPWPELPLAAFIARALLAVLAVAALWRRKPLAVVVSAVVLVAWGVDLASRRVPSQTAIEQRFWQQVHRLSGELALLAQEPPLGQLLAGTGAEAEPEKPFAILGKSWRRLPPGVGGVVVVDGSGEPVAWIGDRPRLPLEWRPVGERAVLPEAWVGEVVLWCREPVYESGRVVGGILASVSLPQSGTGSALGVNAGWGRVLVPRLVATLEARPALHLEVRESVRQGFAASGGALVLMPLAFATLGFLRWGLFVASAAAVAVGWLPLGFSPALVVFFVALLAMHWPQQKLVAVGGAVVVGLVAWALPPLLSELGEPVLVSSLVSPPLVLLANLFALVGLILVLPVPGWSFHLLWLTLPAFAWGLATASGAWLGAGVGLLALTAPRKGRAVFASLGVAAALVGGGDGATRNAILARTESTLARWGEVRSVARALVGSLPEGRLGRLLAASAGRRLVVLGELAEFARLHEVLPGTALVLEDPGGKAVATWGEAGILGEARDQELASRLLDGGFRLRLLAPAPPHDVLAALAASGAGVPVAAFDRAGSPISRGAPFRPLPPGVVGEALARERWWGWAVVGNRSVPTYLRGYGDWVLAVPWMRPAAPDFLLLVVALGLWTFAPLFLWQVRHRLALWWREPASFTGRLRVLAFTSAFLPLFLLANVLPGQWIRERQQARLEVARALGAAVAEGPLAELLGTFVRDLGSTVAVYRPSLLAVTSRPDAALTGGVPMLPPSEAYIRAVRRWREPVVQVDGMVSIFLPVRRASQSLVVGVLGLTEVAGSRFSPGEWFFITGLAVAFLALWAAEVLARGLSVPMARLVDAARRLGRGEQASLTGEMFHNDEFATLAQAFSAMAAEVQARQEELQKQRDLLERVLENLSAAVLVVEGEAVVLTNAAGKKLVATAGLEQLAATFGPTLMEAVAQAQAGTPVSARISPRGQADAVWKLTAVPLAGESRRVCLVLEDLSEVARAERLASLTELARIVAHEVKNPLTPIRLWVEELQAALAKGPAEVAEVARLAVEEILQQVARLKEVSQGFSNLVALEKWEAKPVALSRLAFEVVEDYRVLARRGVRLVFRPAGEELMVIADPSWLRRALRHLLDNSAKALAGKVGEITVQVEREGSWAVVSVRDTAGGVFEEHLPRLFEPHFSTTSEGSGLGLSVVWRVCQKAGGRAEARNLPPGLEVRMLLPLAS